MITTMRSSDSSLPKELYHLSPLRMHSDTQNHPDGSRQLYENLTVPQKKLVMVPDMDHDLGNVIYVRAFHNP